MRANNVSSRLLLLLGAWQLAPQHLPAQAGPAHTATVQPARATSSASLGRTPSLTPRARDFYLLLWGVDNMDVKAAESGQMVRFAYTVVDPAKAAPLNDTKATPALLDQNAHVSLQIPTMDKVGQLRQTGTPEAGKTYWMVFSNKGAVVKPGDRVSVSIGRFRVDGLFVR